MDSEVFKKAARDYYYLRDKLYPEKGSLKMVGDRYRLSSEQRTVLYRGICTSAQEEFIRERLADKPDALLLIDGYNVLMTLLNYRLGHKVFISSDMICRDAGSLFGKIRDENLFTGCLELFYWFLETADPPSFILYLDAPVSKSRTHYGMIREHLSHNFPAGRIELAASADEAILRHKKGILATSDSRIIKESGLRVFDVPRYILENHYHAQLFNLNSLLK